MKSQLFTLILFILFAALLGCQSKRDQLADMCTELSSISKMTDNCSVMAKHLSPLTQKYNATVAEIGTSITEESERIQYIDVVSTCQRMYLEISTGPCGAEKEVREALPFDVVK